MAGPLSLTRISSLDSGRGSTIMRVIFQCREFSEAINEELDTCCVQGVKDVTTIRCRSSALKKCPCEWSQNVMELLSFSLAVFPCTVYGIYDIS